MCVKRIRTESDPRAPRGAPRSTVAGMGDAHIHGNGTCERAERAPLKSFRIRLHIDTYRNTLKVKQRSSKPRQRGQRVLHEEVSRRRYEEEGVDPIEQPAVAGEQVSRVLHVGRALEQRDGEVSDERHHGAHDAVERAWLGLGLGLG